MMNILICKAKIISVCFTIIISSDGDSVNQHASKRPATNFVLIGLEPFLGVYMYDIYTVLNCYRILKILDAK